MLLGPLARLLRPLVRLLIRSGVTFPVLTDLLRSLYVDVARHDLLPDPKARTDSRISLMTGVHRKELRRQRAPETPPAPAVITLNTQIIARWLGSPDTTDREGRPLPLPRAGDAPSFDALVEAVTRDVRPRAVFDDWLSQGIVALEQDDRVHLRAAAFLPREGSEAQLFYFARNLHDHTAAATANVLAAGLPPFLDRSLHYDRLGLDAAVKLEIEARQAAQRMLLELNRTALALSEADDQEAAKAEGVRPTRRVNLGVYLFVEDETQSDPG
ncbi:DUF6502 family protein [Paracraurococcus lichenis]|uniref:DUF6502 family protein n=1 Tax=Paracraurococcus lichenis TaxID=3064888 RepID=A0ABT9EDF2_9PROT|nr:DUF6502 family protein [Paracraurococcus sp. LOR1-02]MDO9714050.1 DUF6502 family protein [Paracraurococcus sp. LOR1-02]